MDQDLLYIKEVFEDSSFVLLGILKEPRSYTQDLNYYKEWIKNSYNADMKYLENNMNVREDSSFALKGVKSSFCFILPYGQVLSNLDLSKYKVSKYALLKDYHKIIKKHGSIIVDKLKHRFSGSEFRVIVDSVPIFEKARACATSTGFRGQNSLYVNYNYGSFVFLSEILTTLDLGSFVYDGKLKKFFDLDQNESRPTLNKCSLCNKCTDSCIPKALNQGVLDARRCLSYLSIEQKGKIAKKYFSAFRDSFFGCDRCQNICPYNNKKKINEDSNNVLKMYEDMILDKKVLSYIEHPHNILFLSEPEFKKLFVSSSFLRAGYIHLCRNILIHLAVNSAKNFLDILNSDTIDKRVFDIVDKKELLEEYNQRNKNS